MTEDQIKELIANEVSRKLAEERKELAKLIERKFLYTGEFVGARRLIDAINEWGGR